MFTNNKNIPIKFLACWQFCHTNVNTGIPPRKYCTLSVRNAVGNGSMSSGGKTIKLEQNMVTLLPHNVEGSRKARFDDFFAIEFEAYNYHGKEIKAVMPSDPMRIRDLFNKTYKCFMHPSPGYLYRCTAYLSEILELLQIEFGNPDEKIPTLIIDSVSFMREHYTDPKLTVSELAKRSHISATYFRSLFEQAFGISPKSYMLKLRLEHSVKLLAATNLGISDIATQSGFMDSRYYTTVFRRTYGLPPSVARRRDDLYNITINKSKS